MTMTKPDNIDAYIAGFPENIRKILEQVRATVSAAAPEAKETIKYAMPTFIFSGNLVHFAAFKNHIGFYPAPTGNSAFTEALSVYKTGKGSVRFPFDQPIPLELITRIVQLRMTENLEKAARKRK